MSEIQTRPDGGSDVVVSFDAFKVSKHHLTTAGAFPWRVSPLTPWARRMIEAPSMPGEINRARGVAEGHPQTQEIMRADFRTRTDALGFLRGLADDATRLPRSGKDSDSHALDLIAALLNGGEWSADTAPDVAEIVRSTGREILDLDEGDE